MFDVSNKRSIGLADIKQAKESRLFPSIDPDAILAAANFQKTGAVSEEMWFSNLKDNLYAKLKKTANRLVPFLNSSFFRREIDVPHVTITQSLSSRKGRHLPSLSCGWIGRA